jgi:hypothetical protein
VAFRRALRRGVLFFLPRLAGLLTNELQSDVLQYP